MKSATLLARTARLIERLESTHGTNNKISELAQFTDLTPLVSRMWNEHDTTGVSVAKLTEWGAATAAQATLWRKTQRDYEPFQPLEVFAVYDALVARELSGDRARHVVWQLVRRYPAHRDTIIKIMTKNLRLGVGLTNVAQAFPGLLVNFSKQVVLGNKYSDSVFRKHAPSIVPPAYISIKIDGVRVITRTNPVEYLSRTGHAFTSLAVLDTEMQKLRAIARTIWPDLHMVFDGELSAVDEQGVESFKLAVSEIKRVNQTMANPIYNIFDVLSEQEFTGEYNPHGEVLAARLERLARLETEYTRVHGAARHWHAHAQTPFTQENFTAMQLEARASNYEGLMVRMNAPYKPGRSNDLLKYKLFEVEEFVVRDVVIDPNYTYRNAQGSETSEPALASVVVWVDNDKKNVVNVGSGFTRDERVQYHLHPELILGKTISVQYQEETQDSRTGRRSLRLPTYHGMHGARRTV